MSNGKNCHHSKVKPRTNNQKVAWQSFSEHDINLVAGPWGSGKTLLTIGWACEQLLAKNYEKIILTRSVGYLGRQLGFVPGDFASKMSEYCRQQSVYFEDILGKLEFEKMQRDRVIQILPVEITRGMSVNNSIAIVDEAQNCKKDEVILMLTRLGRGSKLFFVGATDQSDVEECSFFERMINHLEDIDISKNVFTENDILRHKSLYRIYKKMLAIH